MCDSKFNEIVGEYGVRGVNCSWLDNSRRYREWQPQWQLQFQCSTIMFFLRILY